MRSAKLTNQEGVVAMLAIMAVSIFGLMVITTIHALALGGYKNITAISSTERVFRAAESGINEALYRLYSDPTLSGKFEFTLDGHDIVVVVEPDGYGGIITSQASDSTDKIRTIQLQFTRVNYGGGFDSAVQTGAGGLFMDNNSEVEGNVFSNGDIIGGPGNCQNHVIKGNAAVATGSRISKIAVKEFNGTGGIARGYQISDKSCIDDEAHYWSAATIDNQTTVNGSTCDGSNSACFPDGTDPADRELPITDDFINNEVKAGISNIANPSSSGACPSSYDDATWFCIMSNSMAGDIKYESNLYIDGAVDVLLNGNIWVTGDFVVGNSGNGTTQIDDGLGDYSVVIVADGAVTTASNPSPATGAMDISNNYIFKGADNHPESFILLVSTCDPGAASPTYGCSTLPAIHADNGSTSIVIAAPHGEIRVKQGGQVNAAAAELIHLEETSKVIYNPLLDSFVVLSGDEESIGVVENSWREVDDLPPGY